MRSPYCLSVSSSTPAPDAYPDGTVKSLGPGPAKAATAFLAQLKARFPNVVASSLTDPTAAEVIAELTKMQTILADGDVFVFQYVGHGALATADFAPLVNLPRVARGTFESDAFVQSTLVLNDRMFLQCEFQQYIAALAPGITFVNIIDACNAGAFIIQTDAEAMLAAPVDAPDRTTKFDRRPILQRIFQRLYAENKPVYDRLNVEPSNLECKGIHFAAVSASSTTIDEQFTNSIVSTLATNREFTYSTLSDAVANLMNDLDLQPVMIPIGTADQTELDRPIFT